MKSLTKLEIKWGAIFILVALAWMVFERLMGWHGEKIDQHMKYTNFFMIPAIAVYFFALTDKRKSYYEGEMTYKQGFITGLMITLIVAILSPLSQIITHYVITPDYFNNAIAYGVEELGYSKDKMEDNFNLKSYIIQSTVGAIIMGLFTSSIVSIFTKKDTLI